MVRPPCCEKQNVTKGKWTEEEDTKLLACVSKYGTGNWTVVPKKAGLKRCGKSCRLRWSNYLKPDIRHESFTPQEEELVVKLHAAIGSRWSIIAQQLPGRTDNDVKNYWNTKLKKKLQGMGIDPVTHRPFSQIIADYGSIRDLTISGNQNGCFNSSNRDVLKNTFMSLKSKAPTSEFPNIDTHMMTSVLSSTPKQEPIIYHDINNTRNNNSTDLLSQLQAIQLVTEATNWAKYPENDNSLYPTRNNTSLFYEKAGGSLPLISPSSSSSSTCSTAGQARSPLAFSWRDFLLDDDMLPAAPAFQERQQLQDHENMMEFPSNELHFQTMDVMVPQIGTIDNEGIRGTEYGGSNNHGIHVSSSTDTFVEALLDREDEMLLEFPDLLEEPYYN